MNVDKWFLFFLWVILHQNITCYSENIFSEIYRNKVWATNSEGKGTSGLGSKIESTIEYREFLQCFLETFSIHTVVDIGCGDWEFSKAIDWKEIKYSGFDVVPFVIEENQKRYGSSNIAFFHGDMTSCAFPDADLLICKDVLQHWPNEEILHFLKLLPKFKFCLITNDIKLKKASSLNTDIAMGGFRPIDLTLAPFNISGIKILTFYSGISLKQTLLIQN